jgi:hypothetical protein
VCRSRLQFGLRDSNSRFQNQNLVFYRLNETRNVVGLERFELSPHGVKIRDATVTPQTQNQVCGRAFELLHHVVVGEPRIELGWAARAAWSTATPGATPVCSPRNAESPPRFFLERAPYRWLTWFSLLRVGIPPRIRLLALATFARKRGVAI